MSYKPRVPCRHPGCPELVDEVNYDGSIRAFLFLLNNDLLLSPVMHTDCTNAKVNENICYVYICAAPSGEALYFARKKKGA